MKFLTILFLLGLPGVARASQLDARQVTPSGNSSVTLTSTSQSSSSDSSSSSSQIESTAPSLVATSTTTSSATSAEVATSSSLSKQERGPQDPDVTSPGQPPALAPTIVNLPAEATPSGETLASPATTSTSIIIESTTGTTTLAFSSSTTIRASPEISSAQVTTIATTNTNSPPVASLPPTTLITSATTPSVISSSPPSSETSGIVTITSNRESTSSPTATVTMPSPTPTPSSVSSSTDGNGTSTLTIALSTILSVTGVVLIAIAAYLCTGDRRRRLPMFRIKRGITPIGDDEIATWKSNRSAEKVTDRYTARPSHSQNPSTATSTRRAPSVIQYHNGGRQSYEVASPRSFIGEGKYSFDLPQAPGAVLARAPNARSGLTDEAVPGDDPFLPSPKRHPSRLHKLPPSSPSLHGRTKGSRSSSLRSYAEAAWRDGLEQSSSPRVSSDAHTRSHNRIYSNSSIPPPPRLSFGDNDQLTGLSPPPSRRNDSTIGLAVG